MVSGPEGFPVTAWSTTGAVCNECGEQVHGVSCGNCGERPDARPVDEIGFLTESDSGSGFRLHVFENCGRDSSGNEVWASAGGREVTAEQAGWLLRQGDVRR